MRFDVLTTFPEMFDAVAPAALGLSIPARARAAGLIDWHAHNVRDYTTDKHQKTDDRPFGGGPGMVMTCQPLWDAVGAVEAMDPRPATRVYLTPQGRPLDQELVRTLAERPRLLMICGHYEGIDERVIEKLEPMEVSIGDYVLSGGELAAMVLIDAVTRLIPGVLGDGASAEQDSFAGLPKHNPNGEPIPAKTLRAWMAELGLPEAFDGRLLDVPHYTRPREWEGVAVPPELLSGDHDAVAKWRLRRMVERTRARRPDLLGD